MNYIGLFLYIRDRDWILEKTLNSILNQTFDTKKIYLKLCFNDCKDNSKQIAINFKNKYKNKFKQIDIEEYNFNAEEDNRKDFEKRNKAIKRMAFLKNKLFNYFAKLKDCPNKIMFFDSDIILDSKAIKLMVDSNKDIIGGVVITSPKGMKIYNFLNWNGTCYYRKWNKNGIEQELKDGLFKIDYISGFTMFDKKTFNDIKFGMKEQNGSADDDFAMDIARNKRFEVWADSKITGIHVMNKCSK